MPPKNISRVSTSFAIKLLEHLKTLDVTSSDRKFGFLRYHQAIVQEYINGVDSGSAGLLIAHEMGLGKSMVAAAIAFDAVEKNDNNVIFLITKSLKGNIIGALKQYIRLRMQSDSKFIIENPDKYINDNFSFVSMNASNMMRQMIRATEGTVGNEYTSAMSRMDLMEQRIEVIIASGSLDNKVLIVDEAHNLFRAITNGSSNALNLYRMIRKSKNLKTFLLTGTPISNDPFELVPCLNMIAGGPDPILPENWSDFHRYFVDETANTIRNKNKFQNRIMGLVSRVSRDSTFGKGTDEPPAETISTAKYPKILERKIEFIPMDDAQYAHYSIAKEKENKEKLSTFARASTPHLQKPKNAGSSSYKQQTRQLSNFSPREYVTKFSEIDVKSIPDAEVDSGKLRKMYEIVSESPGIGYIYSQFVGAGGLGIIARFLEKNGWKQSEYQLDESKTKTGSCVDKLMSSIKKGSGSGWYSGDHESSNDFYNQIHTDLISGGTDITDDIVVVIDGVSISKGDNKHSYIAERSGKMVGYVNATGTVCTVRIVEYGGEIDTILQLYGDSVITCDTDYIANFIKYNPTIKLINQQHKYRIVFDNKITKSSSQPKITQLDKNATAIVANDMAMLANGLNVTTTRYALVKMTGEHPLSVCPRAADNIYIIEFAPALSDTVTGGNDITMSNIDLTIFEEMPLVSAMDEETAETVNAAMTYPKISYRIGETMYITLEIQNQHINIVTIGGISIIDEFNLQPIPEVIESLVNVADANDVSIGITIPRDDDSLRNLYIRNGFIIENTHADTLDMIYRTSTSGGSKRVRKYAIISGEIHPDVRERIIAAVNSRENMHGGVIDLLLISATGAEGLDLKNQRYGISFEPYWVFSRLLQVDFRGARANSHIALPPAEHNFQPYLLVSVKPNNEFAKPPKYKEMLDTALKTTKRIDDEYFTTDLELLYASAKNQILVDSFTKALYETSIECMYNGENYCRSCNPNDERLFTNDLEKDLARDDPCVAVEETTVNADEITVDGKKYYYTHDPSLTLQWRVYEFDADLNAYVQVDESTPVYEKIIDILDEKS